MAVRCRLHRWRRPLPVAVQPSSLLKAARLSPARLADEGTLYWRHLLHRYLSVRDDQI